MAPKKDAAKTEDPPLSPPAKDTKAPASKKDDAKDAKAPGGKKVSVKPAADAKKGSKTGEALLGPPEPPPEDPVVTQLKADSEVQKAEIIRLREVLSIIGSGEGDVREAKIIDLFKKNRFLNLSLEKERVRASKMANQIKVLQEELLNKVKAEMSPESDIPDFGQKKEVVETWEEKYKKVLAKMQKIQAKKDMLAADIPKLQNIIRREVGEHIPLNKILEEGTTWRGRSEQIALLKYPRVPQGIRDTILGLKAAQAYLLLQEQSGQLAESQKRLNELEPIASGESRPATYNEQRKMVDLQLMHRNQLEAANYERRKELGNLATSYNLLRDHWEMTKNKLDKTIARKNILEIEIRDAKAKVAVLVSKSENDDLLINALTLELAAARQALGPPFPRPGGPLQLEHHYRCNKMAATLSDLQYQCTQQEKEIKLQDDILDTVRATVVEAGSGDWWSSNLNEDPSEGSTISGCTEETKPTEGT